MARLVALVPWASASPGLYFPVSTPCASGDQTICDMPLALQSGMISFSGFRQSSEYCGWLETKRTTSFIAVASAMHPRGPFGKADIARLARADNFGQRLHCLFQRRFGIEAMALIKVDVIGLEPLERRIRPVCGFARATGRDPFRSSGNRAWSRARRCRAARARAFPPGRSPPPLARRCSRYR